MEDTAEETFFFFFLPDPATHPRRHGHLRENRATKLDFIYSIRQKEGREEERDDRGPRMARGCLRLVFIYFPDKGGHGPQLLSPWHSPRIIHDGIEPRDVNEQTAAG